VFCIGGAGLFVKALPFATRLDVTLVHAQVEGDVYMPAIDWTQWMLIAEEFHPTDDHHLYAFSFRTFERVMQKPIEEELAS
jgi:dihydrofolate reductase